MVTGHAGGSIHDITVATLAVPPAILVASQLSRSTLSWTPPPAPGVGGHTRGAVYSTGGPSVAVFFQASVLLAVLLIATLLLLTPQVLPTRCARPRQLTERTDGCIGVYEGPWACQHTVLGNAEAQRSSTLPLSTAAASHTSTREQKWLAGLSSRPAWYPTRGMPPAAVRLLQAACVQLPPLSTLQCCLRPPSHWSPELLDVSASCPWLSSAPAPSRPGSG